VLLAGGDPSVRKHAWQVDMANVATTNVHVHTGYLVITSPDNVPAHPVSWDPVVNIFALMEDTVITARALALVESTLNATQGMVTATVLQDSQDKDADKNASRVRTVSTAS
jgi:hypothetical protein